MEYMSQEGYDKIVAELREMEPSVYLQWGVVVASSTASEMAVPSEP